MVFGWMQPRVSVEPALKRWIEVRMVWLAEQFGWDRLLTGPTIEPTARYFPDPFDASRDSARALFERTCGYMDLDPSRIDLHFYYYTSADDRVNPTLAMPELDWIGLYGSNGERTAICVEASRLDDPESLVATFAHELAHAHLLGGKKVSADAADLEQLTDLATVYFGLGILPANCSLRESSYDCGMVHYWSSSQQGYLSREAWSYALALRAWLRKERKPAYARFLQRVVRSKFRQALAYLCSTGDAGVAPDQPRGTDHSPERLAHELGWVQCKPADPEGEEGDSGEYAQPDLTTQGMFHVDSGNWQAAIDVLSEAIDQDPDDAEAYQLRALAYVELGRNELAIADANTAVELAPDTMDNYFARGLASLKSGHSAQAIDDFSRYLKEEDLYPGVLTSKAHFFRGQAHAAQGDLRRAVRDYTAAIRQCPAWPQMYVVRADAYEQLGKLRKAAADRREADRRGWGTGVDPNSF